MIKHITALLLLLLFTMSFLSADNSAANSPKPSPAGQSSFASQGGYRLITGVVLNAQKKGVSEAEIVLPGKNIAILSDEQGRFSIKCPDGGSTHIEVYKSGFMPASTKAFNVTGDLRSKAWTIMLYPSPLEEVVVTGTSTPKLYRETPVKTSVASRKAIEAKGAVSLADSLEIVTGVRVEDNCQNCNFTQVRINGMEGKYSQILIDGQPVISSLAGVYALEQIPANMIEKLEVVKGGGSALYGGNAIAGVVNVVTRNPIKSGSRIAVTHQDGNNAPNTNLNLNTDIVAKSQQTHASFFANYQDRDHMDYNGDGFSDQGQLQNISIGSNFGHYFEKINGKMKLNFNYIHEDRRGGNKFELPEHMTDIAESIKTNRMDFGAGWQHTFSLKSILKFNSTASFTKRQSYYGSNQDPNAYGDTTNSVFNINLTYNNFSFANHSIVAGINYNADKLNDLAPAYNREINDLYTDLGLFIQDEIELFKNKATVLLGLRTDRHSQLERMIFSPRVGLVYKGVKNLTMRATFSTGFRAPQVFDEDLHITQVAGVGHIIRNRSGLTEERSHSFTIGFDFGKQVVNKLYQFSIGGFYNRLDNVFTMAEIGREANAVVFERFNSDWAEVYGIEAEVGFQVAGRFEIFTGWTFQKSKLAQPEPDFAAEELFRSPNVYGSLRVSLTLPKLVNLSTDISYTGSMKVPHFAGYISEKVLEKSPAFIVVNLSAARKIGIFKGRDLSVTATVLNVFDRFQQDLDKGMYRDAGYIYGPRMPRTFRMGFKYEF
ncbi:MAG: TonB-dependent receptor [bacterium]|nr:TonB-dependent receptor [bacterium]